MLLSTSLLSSAVLFATASLAAPSPQVDTPAPSACPEVFAIYLGPGNDVQNRTWYFRDLQNGAATRLSAIPEYSTHYRLVDGRLQWADDNPDVYLNSWDDDRTYIMPADDAIKATQQPGWGELLQPIGTSIDPVSCEITMQYKENRYLQRYGFYVHLTPEPTGGQIQWGKPTAVVPPVAPESRVAGARVAFARPEPACEQAYYKEPCPV